MNKVKIPDSLSISGWNAVKNDIGKDKALAPKVQGESAKLDQCGQCARQGLHRVRLRARRSPRASPPPPPPTAVAKFDTAVKSSLKAVIDAATAAGTAANTSPLRSKRPARKRALRRRRLKVATAAKGSCSSGPKDATKFGSDMSAAVDAARAELEAACDKLMKAGDKKAAAPVKASPKALADGKILSALMRKSIAMLRTPKGSPVPIKFMVLFNKANPKDLRLYLGPKPESGLAKLKTQFPPEVKVNRVKDPKGKVVWEKAALTFLSDILKAGPRQADPAVDPPADQGHRQGPDQALRRRGRRSRRQGRERRRAEGEPGRGGGNARRRQGLRGAAEGARLRHPGGAQGAEAPRSRPWSPRSSLPARPRSTTSPRTASTSSSRCSRKATSRKATARISRPTSALRPRRQGRRAGQGTGGQARGAALEDRRGDRRRQRGIQADQGLQGSGREAPAEGGQGKRRQGHVVRQQDRADARRPRPHRLPVAKLEAARSDWIKSRDTAIKEITDLSKAIAVAFASETAQKKAVADAVRKLGELQIKLQTGLDNELNLAIKAKDPEKQADLVDRARDSLASLQDLIETDELHEEPRQQRGRSRTCRSSGR